MRGRILRHNDAILDDAMPDGHILLDPRSGEYFRVEGVAAAVWELCDGDRAEDDIVSTIATRSGTPTEEVARDVAEFVDECLRSGLLIAEPPG